MEVKEERVLVAVGQECKEFKVLGLKNVKKEWQTNKRLVSNQRSKPQTFYCKEKLYYVGARHNIGQWERPRKKFHSVKFSFSHCIDRINRTIFLCF